MSRSIGFERIIWSMTCGLASASFKVEAKLGFSSIEAMCSGSGGGPIYVDVNRTDLEGGQWRYLLRRQAQTY